MDADEHLIRHARSLATGADVHRVNGLCHLYRLLCGVAARGDERAKAEAREAERKLRNLLGNKREIHRITT